MSDRRTQTVPGVKTKAMHGAAYNSRILAMPTSISSRTVSLLFLVLALLPALSARAQNLAGAEEQLAKKIVSATGQKTMALEVLNRSSLTPATADDVRRNLLTQLAALGVRFVSAEQAAATVRVSLSEDPQNYAWIAEIRQGTSAPSVVMVIQPRPESQSVEPPAAAMLLRKTFLWSQRDRILDVAVIDSNPARMLVLDGKAVSVYHFQDNRWQLDQSLAVVHSHPWPRDLRGRLIAGSDTSKDHLFDAYLPGVHCRSGASEPPTMSCSESDDPWPLGTEAFSLNGSFTASRNFFTGALSPGVGKQTTAPAFYSAAAVPREQITWWLFATVDGQVHLLDGSTDQALDKLGWGSDIAGMRSGCGSGWQVLATGRGAGRTDIVRAFEVVGREPIAATATLEMNGAITALWAEHASTGAVTVMRNWETGRYEAFRLTLACGR